MPGAAFTLELVDKVSKPSFNMAGAIEMMIDPAALATTAIAAVGAAVAAAGIALVAGAAEALEQSEALRKLTSQMDALSGGSGKQIVAQLDAIRGALGMTREQMGPLASQLLGVGVSTANLADQMKALATVQAIGINGGTEEYLSILKKVNGESKVSAKTLENLYKTGVNVAEIASKMGVSVKQLQAGLKAGTIDSKKFSAALTEAVTEKGATALAAQAESLTNQWAIFKENIGKLFEGVDAGPFLKAVKSLLSIFDQSTASGRTMKAAITGTFNAIFSIASKVLPYVKAFMLGIVIGALKVYIALKPAIAELGKLFGGGGGDNTKSLTIAAKLGEFIAELAMVFVKAINATITLVKWFKSLYDIGAKIGDAFKGDGIAAQFVQGLIRGITGGAGAVIDAVKNLGSSMLDSVKATLGIHSPSAEMFKLGSFTAKGFAGGVAAANDNVMAAGADMGGAVATGAVQAPASGGGGGNTFNVSITVNGGSSPQETADRVAEAVTEVFERLALTQGLGTAA